MLVFNLAIALISLAILLGEEEEVDEETPFKYSDAWKSIFIVRNLFLPAMLIEFPKRVCCDWKYASVTKLLIINAMMIAAIIPIL